MDLYFAFCVFLCVVSGSSPASLRIPRQVWRDSFMGHDHGHFHFPGEPVPGRAENGDFSNEVFDFPDMMTRPGGMGDIDFGPGFRPRPTGSNNQRPDFSNNPWLNGINTQRPNNNQPWQTTSRTTTARPTTARTTTSRTTPTTTTVRTSTPRTFHLAPEGCDCPSTPQFNPVCGTDGNTYKNSGLLKCFRLCGIDVSQRRMGSC